MEITKPPTCMTVIKVLVPPDVSAPTLTVAPVQAKGHDQDVITDAAYFGYEIGALKAAGVECGFTVADCSAGRLTAWIECRTRQEAEIAVPILRKRKLAKKKADETTNSYGAGDNLLCFGQGVEREG